MSSFDATTTARWAAENRESWATRAGSWRRWRSQLAAWWRPATELLVARAHLRPGLRVLDLASGTGEPALTLAPLVAPGGAVTATDLIPEMLVVAAEEAARRGLTNIGFQPADAGDLPFPDASFDLVTCRFGVIFFPDLPRALREVRRVLRPDGRAIFLAWGPFERNTYTGSTVGVVLRHLPPLPPPEPGAPSGDRFAAPGTLSAALREAGLTAEEETVALDLPWPGGVRDYLAYVRDDWAVFDQLLDRLPPGRRDAVLDEVVAAVGQYDDGHQLAFSAPVVVATATR
jgi:SAM-dependent methyltransferase